MIFTCIGFNFTKISKEKQQVILQLKLIHKMYRVGPHVEIIRCESPHCEYSLESH